MAYCAYMYVCVRVSSFGVSDSCELLHGFLELNLGPLEEQSVIVSTGPSLSFKTILMALLGSSTP